MNALEETPIAVTPPPEPQAQASGEGDQGPPNLTTVSGTPDENGQPDTMFESIEKYLKGLVGK